MRTANRAGFVTLVIAIFIAISGGAARSDEQTPLRLFDLTTAHGVADKQPFRPAQVFAPEDNPIFVWFRAEGCTTGTTIRSLW
jgi:hypothetical protein